MLQAVAGLVMPRNFGISGVREETADELDEMKREWDRAEAGTVSRSDVAREALEVGLEALQHEAFKPAGGQFATQERRAVVRQALIDHFSED